MAYSHFYFHRMRVSTSPSLRQLMLAGNIYFQRHRSDWRISRCVMPNNCNFWPGDWLLKWKTKFYFAQLFLVPWCTNALITNYASVWTFPESKVTTSAQQRRSNSCWKKQNPRLWWLLKDLSEKRCIGYWNAFHRLNLVPFTLPKENWHFISCYESKSLTDLS